MAGIEGLKPKSEKKFQLTQQDIHMLATYLTAENVAKQARAMYLDTIAMKRFGYPKEGLRHFDFDEHKGMVIIREYDEKDYDKFIESKAREIEKQASEGNNEEKK